MRPAREPRRAGRHLLWARVPVRLRARVLARAVVAHTRLRVRAAVAAIEASPTRAGRFGRGVLAVLRVPTNLGWSVLGLGAGSGVVAALFGWRELAVVAGGCGAAMLYAIWFTRGRALLDVEVKVAPERIVPGETTSIRLVVTNNSDRALLPVRLELPIGSTQTVIWAPRLRAHATFTPDHPIVYEAKRRGVVLVGPVSSVRGDPLGLLRRARAWSATREVLVYPTTVPAPSLGAGMRRDLEGQATKDLSMNDVAFHALREYAPGDDPRHVHWPTTARTGTLMVRQFVDTRTSYVAILVSSDMRQYEDDGEYELALSVAGSLGLTAIRERQQVSLHGAGPVARVGTSDQLLERLTRARFGAPDSDLLSIVTRATRGNSGISVAAIIAGRLTERATVMQAASRFGPDVRVIAVMLDRTQPWERRRVGQVTVARVPSLADLRPALGKVAA